MLKTSISSFSIVLDAFNGGIIHCFYKSLQLVDDFILYFVGYFIGILHEWQHVLFLKTYPHPLWEGRG